MHQKMNIAKKSDLAPFQNYGFICTFWTPEVRTHTAHYVAGRLQLRCGAMLHRDGHRKDSCNISAMLRCNITPATFRQWSTQRFGDFTAIFSQCFGDFIAILPQRFGDFTAIVPQRFGDFIAIIP